MATKPITTRLEPAEIARLDVAVACGDAPDRASTIAQAVTEWLNWHDRDRIADSYAKAYAEHPQTEEELAFSTAAARALLQRTPWSE